jgi:methyl-accepting chemotaxis protein
MASDAAHTATLTQQANVISINSLRIVQKPQQTLSTLRDEVEQVAFDVDHLFRCFRLEHW